MKRCAMAIVWAFFPRMIAPVLPVAYEVGPGKGCESIGDVPWETLTAGDLILIYYREEPYREKWVICRQGTETEKIVVRGMPDENEHLPVIGGIDATTRSALNFSDEARGIIKIGGANSPPDCMPRNILIENLDVKSGGAPYSFTGRSGRADYSMNAAAVYVEKGENITIRNCILRDCGNGLFCASGASNVLVESCSIHANGVEDPNGPSVVLRCW